MLHEFDSEIIEVKDSLGWSNRVVVPDHIMDHFRETDKRVICSVNQSEEIHIALHSAGDGTYFITFNKQFRKKNVLIKGQTVHVKLKSDNSKYGMATPDFWVKFCHQDPEGDRYFHALTAGKQRSLLHIITKLKSEHKQLEKALTIFDYLKSVEGKLDFKELNQAFKNSHFKL